MFDQQKQLFCYSLKKTDDGMVREGLSPRYTMMTLMGLHRLEEAGGTSPIEIAPVLKALLSNLDWVEDIGDLGVLLWTCALVAPERLAEIEGRIDLQTTLGRYRSAQRGVTMELAWFLTGLSNWALVCPEKLAGLRGLALQTLALLKKNRGEQGFFGHLARGGSVVGMTRGRIGSFADQVYPIYAMTRFSQAYQDEDALKMAVQCGRGLCEAQGSLGQWWWHYDSLGGGVLEGYPVFSVHQHAMGPMTMFALGEAAQIDFTPVDLSRVAMDQLGERARFQYGGRFSASNLALPVPVHIPGEDIFESGVQSGRRGEALPSEKRSQSIVGVPPV